MKNNQGKFLTELSKQEIKIFETVAIDILTILGYPLCFENQQLSLNRFHKWIYSLQNFYLKYQQRKKLFQEEWRKERSAMLSQISQRQKKSPMPIIKAVNYSKLE